MNVSIKFDVYPLGGLSGNVQKPKSVTDRQTDMTDELTERLILIVHPPPPPPPPPPNSIGGVQLALYKYATIMKDMKVD